MAAGVAGRLLLDCLSIGNPSVPDVAPSGSGERVSILAASAEGEQAEAERRFTPWKS
jgi:hypothetical protein